MPEYIDRTCFGDLKRLASQYPVVTITGPRQSGKTTIAKLAFPDYEYVSLENKDLRQLASSDPRGFLQRYNKLVILDEFQRAPDLTSYIQELIDQDDQKGRFILTGSQQFEVLDTVSQSLAGRSAMLRLLPLTYEELHGNKTQELDEVLFKGFYPRIHKDKLVPSEALSFYISNYLERDVRQLINIKDLATFERFLELCATNVGQLLNMSKMGSDCGVDQKTIKSWLSVLQASYIIFLLQPHHKNLKKRVVKSPKLYFYDVGLASRLLKIETAKQIFTHPLRGSLFENFVIAELLKHRYNAIKDNNLYFFRDNQGLEIDVLIDGANDLKAVEVKSSMTYTPVFKKNIDSYKKLAGKLCSGSAVVYAGQTQAKSGADLIINFADLPMLID